MKNANKILQVRQDQIIIQGTNGSPAIKPNTAYNNVKFGLFNGGQIKYKFDKKITARESKRGTVFDCQYGNDIKIRTRRVEEVAAAILEHNKNGNIKQFIKILSEEYCKEHGHEILNLFFAPYEKRVISYDLKQEDRQTAKEYAFRYEIDGIFAVYSGGSTQVLEPKQNGTTSWKSIDIDAVGKKEFAPKTITTKQFGCVMLDHTTQLVMAKVMFLLHPNTRDEVFMLQIPKPIRKQVDETARGQNTQ